MVREAEPSTAGCRGWSGSGTLDVATCLWQGRPDGIFFLESVWSLEKLLRLEKSTRQIRLSFFPMSNCIKGLMDIEGKFPSYFIKDAALTTWVHSPSTMAPVSNIRVASVQKL